MYISEFDRQQLIKNLDFIKENLGNKEIVNRVEVCLRSMAMTLSEKDKMPICDKCGAYLSYCCKVCS